MPATRSALVRQVAARQVDARDLEERDPVARRRRRSAAPPRRGSGGASCAARSARPRSARGASTVVSSSGTRLGVYVSAKPRPTSASSTRRRSCCSRVSVPNISRRAGSVNGTSSSRKRAISSTTSISRVTSRARQVGTTTSSFRRSKPSRSSSASWSAGGVATPITSSARSCRKRTTRPLGQAVVHVGVGDPRRARQLEQQLGREVGGRLGEVRVDALLPAVRALGAEAQPLRGEVDAVRLEVRGLEQDGRRLVADLGLLAAHDPGERDRALGVGDHQVVGRELAVDAVERAQSSRRARARRTTIRPPSSFAKSNACSGFPSASMT